MEEWKEYRLGDVCSRLRSGKSIPSAEITSKGMFSVIGGNGFRGYTNMSNFKGDCVVIGRQGANCGNVHYYSGEYYMTEHAIVVVGNRLSDTYFLGCVMSLMQLGNLSSQSAQPGLSVKTLSEQIVRLPSVDYQKKISTILKSLDEKIRINRKINSNLDCSTSISPDISLGRRVSRSKDTRCASYSWAFINSSIGQTIS